MEETTSPRTRMRPKVVSSVRFTAPGCEPVCCDGNRALPFARGVFDLAMCTDALMYIWEKRPFVGELARAVDGSPRGTVLINHTHNQLVWNPSQGDALTPGGYRVLFETMTPRVFGESPQFLDIDGDGRPEILAVSGASEKEKLKQWGWYAPDWSAPEKPWRFVAVTAPGPSALSSV